jgi:hypothetical protein
MCDGVEYFLDGERVTVYFGEPGAELPIRTRAGAIAFLRWGALGKYYFSDDNRAGWGRKFPEGGWASLASIRAGEWTTLEPRPVRIMASRFIHVNSWQVPRYFSLKRGEFIQGLLAQIDVHRRVYVVTVPPPSSESPEEWKEWPRIIGSVP